MLRQSLWTLACAVPLTLITLAGPANANGPVKFEIGLNPQFKVSSPQGGDAPWYLYWPAEARYLYKAPGPMPYPFWPSQNAAPPAAPLPMIPPPMGGEPVPDLDLGVNLTPTAYWWYHR